MDPPPPNLPDTQHVGEQDEERPEAVPNFRPPSIRSPSVGTNSPDDGNREGIPSGDMLSPANAGSPNGGAGVEFALTQAPWFIGVLGDVVGFGVDYSHDSTLANLLGLDFRGLLQGSNDEEQQRQQEWELFERFIKWRHDSQRPIYSRQALQDAWRVFALEFASDPVEWCRKLQRTEASFVERTECGMKMLVHARSIEAGVPCAVRRSDGCPLCPPGAPCADEYLHTIYVSGVQLPVSLLKAIYNLEHELGRVGRASTAGKSGSFSRMASQSEHNALKAEVASLSSKLQACWRYNEDLQEAYGAIRAELRDLKRDHHELNRLRQEIDEIKRGVTTSCQSLLSTIQGEDAVTGSKRPLDAIASPRLPSQRRSNVLPGVFNVP